MYTHTYYHKFVGFDKAPPEGGPEVRLLATTIHDVPVRVLLGGSKATPR